MFPSKFTFHRSISFLLVFTFCLISTLNAQQSIGGEPYSFLYPDVFSSKQLSAIQINTPDLQLIQAEDIQRDRQGKYTRYAVWENVSIDLNNSGEWTELPNGDRVWRLQITGKKALALNLLYDNFYLPTDSRFFIYNAAQTHVLGAFSSLNNKESGVFASANVRGETSILEYYEPAAVRGEGIISIEKVGYVYRFVDHPLAKNSEPCEVDVNCSEGNNWQDEKRGVVRISVVAPDGAGWCSGSLINNTGQDCKAYILTALHCGETSTTANFNQYIFYFNYESSGCAVNDASDNQSITGCVKRADSNDGGGNTGSDYMLVELNNSIPSNYNVYYNGWNAANTASGSGVSIHHPAGDRKKISTYSSVLISSSWQNVPNTHWEVQWVETANGHGVTEGGSSGSAIFDNTGRIVGQLTGGGSFCDDTDATDLYGKMSYNWTSNANGDDLKTWLDPTNSGVLQLAGSNNPCAGGGNPTCSDGMMNGDETGVDCGGSTCDPGATAPTCNDGMMNGNETGVDCGGPDCEPCTADPTCNDGMMNGNETGVDCGGPDCRPCSSGCETMTLVINFDDFPDETTWEVKQNGNVIEFGGPYDVFLTTVTKTMCLDNGCYEFIIYDDAEDGICCGDFGDGNYTLTNSSNQVMA
ncbi:MAG: serine protease, partial [Saprospiraceae bacterium]